MKIVLEKLSKLGSSSYSYYAFIFYLPVFRSFLIINSVSTNTVIFLENFVKIIIMQSFRKQEYKRNILIEKILTAPNP